MARLFVALALVLGLAACHPNDADVAQLARYKAATTVADRQLAAGCTAEAIECDTVHHTCAQLHIARAFACKSLAGDPSRRAGCPDPVACAETSMAKATTLLPKEGSDAERIDIAKNLLFAANSRLTRLTGGPADKAQCPSLAEGLALVRDAEAQLAAVTDPKVAQDVQSIQPTAKKVAGDLMRALDSPVRSCPK